MVSGSVVDQLAGGQRGREETRKENRGRGARKTPARHKSAVCKTVTYSSDNSWP